MPSTDDPLNIFQLYDYIPGFPERSVADSFSDSIGLDDLRLISLRFLSLRWLRKRKQVAVRHKDLDDLEHLPGS